METVLQKKTPLLRSVSLGQLVPQNRSLHFCIVDICRNAAELGSGFSTIIGLIRWPLIVKRGVL